MKTLTDRGILWRTFPVIPRKRLKFNPEIPIEFPLFGSSEPVFKCLGGYFTHNSYNLLDWFVSRWDEIVGKLWLQRFREDRPSALKQRVKNLSILTPILNWEKEDLFKLQNNLPELFQHFHEFAIIPQLSDLEMRKHPALERLSSKELNEVIERTSRTKIKTIYPLRIFDSPKRKNFGWFYQMNLKDSDPWSHLFEYRLLEERKSKTDKVIERVYKFGFTGLFSLLMIHNSVCGASWNMNPKFYKLSGDAQLLYRYLVIAGSRNRVNRLDYIGHRLGWREKQKKRLLTALEPILQELVDAGLVGGFKMIIRKGGKYFCSLEMGKAKSQARTERELT
jgi:hypothetical protein